MIKSHIQNKLERAVKKYFIKHPDVKLVVVAGSVGKTTTKIAIGTVLAQKYRIRLHEGNHNSELSAPLAILGVEYPNNVHNLFAWWRVFRAVRRRIKQPADVDVIIQEIGTDAPGQIAHFGTYLKPDIAVITAVSPEHMEFFKTMDVVAQEELTAANFSKDALINRDDIAGEYARYITDPKISTYGTTDVAEYHFVVDDYAFEDGFDGSFVAPGLAQPIKTTVHLVGDHSIRAAVAAGAVGHKLGLSPQELAAGISQVRPVNGRMNILKGSNDVIIIDDSYNSSPLAVASALRALYQIQVPQRIAVLGSMNELGGLSAEAHRAVGELCDPAELAYVVTVGEEAAKYLAPVASTNGCQVVSFATALEAGAFVHKFVEPGGAVLFKGSQGGIYLEEAIKIILHSTDDEALLVRQSPAWLKKKQKFFEAHTIGA